MAWRISPYLIEGELDNTRLGEVTGWMRFAGMNETVTLSLKGDFHRDLRGAKIRLTGDASQTQPPADAQAFMEGFAVQQVGKVGDITAGLPPADYVNYPYVEWYSDENGRVLIELEPQQVEVIDIPIPACESDPISRDQQNRNMAEFLGTMATELNLPKEHVVCISGNTVIQADKRTAKKKVRGMKLLTQEIRKKLPPLYAQEDKGGKAIVHMKLFTPDGSFTWYITEGSPITDDSGKEVDFHFFGLVDGLEKELGYVALSELESVRGPLGLPIERDLWWEPKTLQEIAPEMFRSDEKTEE
jgi:exonuclease III